MFLFVSIKAFIKVYEVHLLFGNLQKKKTHTVSANKSPLCPSYLMSLAPRSSTWTAAWPLHFSPASLLLFFSLPSPTSSLFFPPVFIWDRKNRGGGGGWGVKREHLCWPTCSQCHFHGAVCCSSVVFSSLSLLLGPSFLCRHTKWHGHSWSQWTRTMPRTTTGLSRNQWVSGGCLKTPYTLTKKIDKKSRVAYKWGMFKCRYYQLECFVAYFILWLFPHLTSLVRSW